ncbi:hypothetical protein QCA50_020163 [Cerrena zonata]|uniref:Cytochrome P450 n=1 Tax=Cerrena zonata TaxID=2478898 RepID=A0AAW0FCV5_9APHY
MNSLTLSSFWVTCAAILGLLYKGWKRRTEGSKLPPGPKGHFIFGNFLQIPSVAPWLKFNEWSKIYGDVVLLRLPIQTTIILCSTQSAFDLLDKRSNIYSDRPRSVMEELTTWDFSFAFMPYSLRWRRHRRYFHQYFHQGVIQDYQDIQRHAVWSFLRGMIDNKGNNPGNEVRNIFSDIIINVMYGINTTGDEYAYLAETSVRAFSEIHVPGMFWVEYLPSLRHLPGWLPGVQFKKYAQHYKPYIQKMINQPFDMVKAALENGTASPSVTASLLKEIEEKYHGTPQQAEEEEIAKNVAGLGYAAAADTTASAAQVFLIAMAFYPEVQKKAQAEIETVVGLGRLPDFGDGEHLPYIRAVMMEVLRWKPVVPFDTPHAVMEDDEYRGMFIPKGTIVIANVWNMLHDPEVFPDPETFNPSRFLNDGKLDPNILDPSSVAFGFGRRICPGRHLSDASLFLTVTSILHTFDILLDPDFRGNDVEMLTGLISAPIAVPCTLKLRSQTAERLVRNVSD